jgi:hypothetical protein
VQERSNVGGAQLLQQMQGLKCINSEMVLFWTYLEVRNGNFNGLGSKL